MSKVFFTVETNSSGGAERVISNLANYFSEDKNEVWVINADSDSHFYPLSKNVKNVKLKIDMASKNRLGRIIKKIRLLAIMFKSEKPDAVITFLFNMEMPTIIAALITKTPVYTSVRNSANAYPKYVRIFRRLTYPFINGVVFQSSAVMNHKDFSKVKNRIVIGNPLPTNVKEPITPIDYKERKKTIITAGRLNEQKNQELLIKAFIKVSEEYDDFELHIYGKGELYNYLNKMIAESSAKERIFLEGEVENAIYNNRDAFGFVLSSNFEGFPNALEEAMCFGIPSICTIFDSGVSRELINDGDNGFLFNVGDCDGLVRQLRKLLSLNEDEYNDLAIKASNIFTKYNNKNIGNEWEQFVLHNNK